LLRAKEGAFHILYLWLVVGLAVWQLGSLFPVLDLDRGRELLVIVCLGLTAEWLAVSFPYGQLSGGFALVLSAFLIYGEAATAWVNGLAVLFGQGIANRGNPLRTTLFNAGQYILAVRAAGYAYKWCGGVPGPLSVKTLAPLAAFAAAYILVNHLLIYVYLFPKRRYQLSGTWLDTVKWDGLTYLFTIPLGLLIAQIYGYVGLSGTLMLFLSVLALQFILRFYVRLQVVNRELTAFYDIAKLLEGNPAPAEIAGEILNSAAKAFSFHTGIVYLRSGSSDVFLPAAVSGPYAKQLENTAVYAGEGIIGCALTERKPEIVFDAKADPRTSEEIGLCQILRSMLIVPLLTNREELGIVVIGDKRPQAFDEKHLHIMAVLGGQAVMAVENAVLGERLELALSRDNPTGLLTCTVFLEMATELCSGVSGGGAGAGMILVDVDHFKEFNRRFGRAAAERALAELAGLIEGVTRRGDLAARYGGDEFALLLPGAGGTRLLDKAESLWRDVRGHVFLRKEGKAARLTVSIGVAEFPRDAGDAAGLFKAAERALEKAKNGGRDRVEVSAVTIE